MTTNERVQKAEVGQVWKRTKDGVTFTVTRYNAEWDDCTLLRNRPPRRVTNIHADNLRKFYTLGES